MANWQPDKNVFRDLKIYSCFVLKSNIDMKMGWNPQHAICPYGFGGVEFTDGLGLAASQSFTNRSA
jgi:hypothetical protein